MFVLRRTISTSLVLILLFSAHSIVLGNTTNLSFKDVPTNHWASAAIQQVAVKKIIEGYPGGVFKPSNQVTRAEFAAMLVRAMPTDQSKEHPFTDVPATHWASEAINKALAIGFINANDFKNNKFEPNKPLTRAEMAKWMANGLASIEADYLQAIKDTKDTLLPIPEYYKGGLNKADIPYIAVAMGTGLLNGYQDYSFKPQGTTTRAEVAALLIRFMNVTQKKPSDFIHLEELRAVGTTGTNVELTTDYKIIEGKEFSNVRGKNLSWAAGTAQIHRLIFLDPWTKETPSIYMNMFYHEDYNRWLTSNSYIVFIEKSFVPSIPLDRNFSTTYHNTRLDSPLARGQRPSNPNIDSFQVNPLGMNVEEFQKKNIGQNYWEQTTISRTNSSMIVLPSDDKSEFQINLRR